MSLSALQEFTFKSKYAQWNENKNRRETWNETCDRFCDMFIDRYGDCVKKYVEKIRKSIKKKKVLGSQRGLQFGGKAILKKNLRMFNCLFTYCDRPKVFQEIMYGLLCGCGFGYSVQYHHINKLPNIVKPFLGEKTYIIQDSIEGWSDAIGVLINSYFDNNDSIFPDYAGYKIVFDYSLISAEGTRLSSCFAKAPGPKPLIKAIENIRNVLDSSKNRLTPLECHDIICFFADSVVSGGVRRSALISLFSKNDNDMMKCKTGNWYYTNPQRGRANNSVMLLREETSFEEFQEIIKNVKEFGEPGFVFCDSLEMGVNPCCEISFFAYDENGNSGVQGCNLSTINAGKIRSKYDFYKACRDAAIIGTLQAGFTNFPYLGKITENIFNKEALLGVSMTGIMENPEICLDPNIQKIGAKIVKRTNEKIAKLIGINKSARTTCCKPEGTSSCILGTSSGIHPHHAKRYIRRVQANKIDDVYKFFKKFNPTACQPSVWSQNKTDDVIAFTIEVRDGAKLKNQVSAIELLEAVKITQQNWVSGGKNLELCSKPWLEHNVSNTISVSENEWEDVTKFIYNNRSYFCGISLLPSSGDKDYPQAPFTEVFLSRELVSMYGDAALFASGLIEKAKELFDNNLWLSCDTVIGINSTKLNQEQIEWCEKAKKYANKYLGGDIKKLTYCLKDVDNWKYYVDLKREYNEVDYELLIEEVDNTNFVGEVACSGGACLI